MSEKIGSDVIGKRLRTPKISTNVSATTKKLFDITLKYKKGKGESFIVKAKDSKQALKQAFEERKDKHAPIQVTIIDVSLGELTQINNGNEGTLLITTDKKILQQMDKEVKWKNV